MKEFIGYHGTNKTNRDGIYNHGFHISGDGYLGRGIYFFENSYNTAENWTKNKKGNSEQYSIIEVKIIIEESKVYDLTDPCGENNIELTRMFNEWIERSIKETSRKISQNKLKLAQGKVIDMICNAEKYEMVRAFTAVQQVVYDDDNRINFFPSIVNAIEICLKTKVHIKNINYIYN